MSKTFTPDDNEDPSQALNVALTIDLANVAATHALAKCLANLARPGDVFALYGDLGTGKTEFARAFIRAMGDPDEEVPSPTFTLVQTYDNAQTAAGNDAVIWHFDLYRLEVPEEAFELNIEDAIHDGIVLIEWPERLGPYLPHNRLDIRLRTVPSAKNRRQAVLTPHATWGERIRECGHG